LDTANKGPHDTHIGPDRPKLRPAENRHPNFEFQNGKGIPMTLPTTASRAAVSCIFLALAAGCASKKDATKDNFKAAINTYYSAHPECLWSTTVKFPTRADTSDTSKTAGFDALTDQGLLARQADSRKVFIFGSKEVSDYDLTDKGRAAWTADPQNPGSGNFCYGHRDVTTVDDLTANGGTATADYHYQLGGVAPWADNAELKTAFPTVQANLAGPLSDKASLTLTDNGWVVTKAADSVQ
jgi:hypothetical protein